MSHGDQFESIFSPAKAALSKSRGFLPGFRDDQEKILDLRCAQHWRDSSSLARSHLEILQTRIFSVMLWHHVTYLVVTFTLLGFAAAGAFVAIRPSAEGDLPLKLARFTALYGLPRWPPSDPVPFPA